MDQPAEADAAVSGAVDSKEPNMLSGLGGDPQTAHLNDAATTGVSSRVLLWADASRMLGSSEDKDVAMERWRQRKAQKREMRKQKSQSDCNDVPAVSEWDDLYRYKYGS